MKKMIIFTVIVVLLFGALIYVNNYKNKEASEGNPYNKSTLDQATIKQLDDPNYQNQILPDDLEEKLVNGEDVTVYFYSPTCEYCLETTPKVVPLTEELGIDLKKVNLLEFNAAWNTFGIESTPTLVRYENGEEVGRIVGAHPEENFEAFFNDHVLD
ncbi:thioredoxin family protein [Aquibacillus koreensis]|uniref:Thioredoxin family protein n=1 Tax=Aquibacillus koreensis TaxID=279446 RepID=A0A9X3WK67_9BACI|nr:thioredoxin family protein [Aquibacillus koreensis]MCT2535580.1 thioredoxin family protein [Aquibacillus koreensis]MDC3420135.1 thioredoxin family protein [Aquibacillus koreensis]